jgi:basic membrane protein A
VRRFGLISLFVAFALFGALAIPVGAAPPVKVGVAYDAAGLGDEGFNDLTQSGALAAEEDFGIKLFELELVKQNGDLLEQAKVIQRQAKRSDLVVAVAFTYQDAVDAVAATEPDTNFVVIDSGSGNQPPNVLSATMATNEGSFLVGAAAALESETGTIGFVGGVDIPVIFEFRDGFIAGVEHIDADASVLIDYVSSAPDLSGFQDPARAYEIATGMFEAGADVVFQAAGGSGIGVIEAARDHSLTSGEKVRAIGVDFDQYLTVGPDLQPYVLTSMVKNVDVVTYDVIASQVDGTFTGGYDRWGLARDGVDYATSGGYLADYITTLEGLRQDIIDGMIVVPGAP